MGHERAVDERMVNLKRVSRILNRLINIVFYPAIVLAVAVGVLFVCGVHPYITMSGSMEPEIHTGSVCFVNTKADYNIIQIGDVIAYETSLGELVTHGVIGVTPEGLRTKGINNEVSDGISTTAENFRGKILFSVPYAGYVLKALQHPQVFSAVIVLIASIFLFGSIASCFAKKEKSEQKANVHTEENDMSQNQKGT